MKPESQHPSQKPAARGFRKRKLVPVVVIVLVVVVAAITYQFFAPKSERVDSSKYQVVYMATGQAYFGKLRNTTGEYLVLEKPYTAQDVQSEQSQQNQQPAAGGQTTLLKVSQQAYGPEDVMSLKADQVLFWQNLRGDSKVSQAIKNAQ